MSIVEDTERTRFCPQTDRRTDGQGDTSIPPYQLRWSGGYNYIKFHHILWGFWEILSVGLKFKRKYKLKMRIMCSYLCGINTDHITDVMSIKASQITSNFVVYSRDCSGWQQRKCQNSHYNHWWIPSTKGEKYENCFHVMDITKPIWCFATHWLCSLGCVGQHGQNKIINPIACIHMVLNQQTCYNCNHAVYTLQWSDGITPIVSCSRLTHLPWEDVAVILKV